MKFIRLAAIVAVAAALAPAVSQTVVPAEAKERCGGASWYALTSMTASGERMNPSKLTAAHRSLSFGTELEVVNQDNGKTVTVRINDRGPFIDGRVIDLSKAAASEIGMISAGVADVCFQVVG